MASFERFIGSLHSDADKRGKQFERFVKWFLTHDPEWSTQVDQIWHWDDFPGRWGRDCGIDLVFQHKDGSTYAVQAKCYDPTYEITKSDVDRFLSESNRKAIDHRLLIATTDRLGANARQVCEAQEKPVVRYLRSAFEAAALEYPDDISLLAQGRTKPPPDPRPHQLEAIENVVTKLADCDRGQLIMACGSGKTLVSLWVKERLEAERTLVLVPSLGLLSQILNDWTGSKRTPFDVMCVCSDVTVGKRDEDQAISLASDVPFPVTSEPAEIAKFLRAGGDRVVFSTYQSSPLIAAAQQDQTVPAFDLVIADEAHRTAGKVGSAFAAVLDSTKIRSKKRLFATATPRTYSSALKTRSDEMGVTVAGMDEVAVYGERLHTLSFGEAIERGLLTDYRVVIVGVDDATVAEWIRDRRIVGTGPATDEGVATDAKSLAAEIGLLKAIKDYDLRRLISFHGRIKRAKQFAQELQDVSGWIRDRVKLDRTLWCDTVSGEMPTIARKQKLQRLKTLAENEVGLLSNARCLSEGVDVPSLDGVAFIDPRSSQIDIVQAVGRAIRLSANKTTGTIIIPVFVEAHEDPEAALESSSFKPIWDILDALKAHDDVLSDQLDTIRMELGSGARSIVGDRDLSKIVFDLPTSIDAAFADSLRTYLVTKTTESWMFWYGLLQAYLKANGHCDVQARFITDDGYRLGGWVSAQRSATTKGTLSADRRRRLEELGFLWGNWETAWEEGFEQLARFQKVSGHCRVPPKFRTSAGYRLGHWVRVQRALSDKGELLVERKNRLNEIGFVWNPFRDQWEAGLKHLQAFRDANEHCDVPFRLKTQEGFQLGLWVMNLRNAEKRGKLSPDRKSILTSLGFIWSSLDSRWHDGFDHLRDFVKLNGHANVPNQYVSEDGYALGQWVSNNRRGANNGRLPIDRKRRLGELGLVWSTHYSTWEEGFQHLVAFHKANGSCDVRFDFIADDGYRLGRWVNKQRSDAAKGSFSTDRRRQLDKLDFAWSAHDSTWEEGFGHLTAFHKANGNCDVRSDFTADDGYRLGTWVNGQRRAANKGKLSTDRKQSLDGLGFIWNALETAWEDGFQRLAEFRKTNGNCNVPALLQTDDGYRLGQWVHKQRQAANKGSLSTERIKRLGELGFAWRVMPRATSS